MLEHLFREVAQTVGLLAEAAVVLIVAWGAAEALFRTVRLVLLRQGEMSGRRDIGMLGAIAAIRTGLNWFLARDITHFNSKAEHKA